MSGGEKNTIVHFEGIVLAAHVGVLGLASLGISKMTLGRLDVVVPTGEESFRGSVVSRTGGAGLESCGGVRMTAAIEEEGGKASRSLDRVVVGKLGGRKASVPGVLAVVTIAA
jgi:hypothetical protein